jgi:hypothetical protein
VLPLACQVRQRASCPLPSTASRQVSGSCSSWEGLCWASMTEGCKEWAGMESVGHARHPPSCAAACVV